MASKMEIPTKTSSAKTSPASNHHQNFLLGISRPPPTMSRTREPPSSGSFFVPRRVDQLFQRVEKDRIVRLLDVLLVPKARAADPRAIRGMAQPPR